MIITYYGHSMFQIELAKGKKILIDPYDNSVGYTVPTLKPDYISISHNHHDHNYTLPYEAQIFAGKVQVIKEKSASFPADNIEFTLIPTYHDKEKGKLRGENSLILIETEGLRILHLGDLGHLLSAKIIGELGRIDILLAPVGGYYTINAQEAKMLYEEIRPAVLIPMHYQTESSAKLPITTLEVFSEQFPSTQKERVVFLRVTGEDLSEQPAIALLEVNQ